MPERLFEYGGEWIGQEPGRPGYYRYRYDRTTQKVRRSRMRGTDFEAACREIIDAIERDRKHRAPDECHLAPILDDAVRMHAPTLRGADNFARQAGYIAGHFGEALVSEVTRAQQEAFIRSLGSKGLGANYIRKVMLTLSKSLRLAHEHEKLTTIPYIIMREAEIADMIGGLVSEARERILSLDECARLFDHGQMTEHVFRFAIIAFNTAARPEACTELTSWQVDLEHRFVDLNPAGRRQQANKRRPVIALTDNLAAWAATWGTGRFVVERVERRDGSVRERAPLSVKKGFNRSAARAGLDGVTRYTIRHTMATWMRKSGVPKWEVEGWLGHSLGSSVTERYAKYSSDYLSAARQSVDSFMAEVQARCSMPLTPRPSAVPLSQLSHKSGRSAGI